VEILNCRGLELAPEATHKKYLSVRREGKREVQRLLDYYNLDMIIPVGYRELSRSVRCGTSAQFTGQVPGNITIGVTYTTPGMETYPDTHVVTAFGVGSITGPICVNSGSTLTKDHFTIMTDPIGFEGLVTVSPLTFSTLSQSEEATVIASCGPGTADDATTRIIVINSNVKNGKSISFDIPNFLNDVLKKKIRQLRIGQP